MKHLNSETKVYQTTDYSIFRTIDGNRAIDRKKIDRIITEINGGNDILDEVPILVSESGKYLDVTDGQHRLEVAKKLKRPVQYILRKKLSLYNIAKINTNVEKWKAKDFINAYKVAGNLNYKKIEEFHKTYKISIGLCLVLLQNGMAKNDTGYGSATGDFEQGRFEVRKHKEAIALAEICKTYEAFAGWNSRGFIYAIQRIVLAQKCDMDFLLKKFKEDPERLKHQPTAKHYLTNLEEIYNVGKSKRVTIY